MVGEAIREQGAKSRALPRNQGAATGETGPALGARQACLGFCFFFSYQSPQDSRYEQTGKPVVVVVDLGPAAGHHGNTMALTTEYTLRSMLLCMRTSRRVLSALALADDGHVTMPIHPRGPLSLASPHSCRHSGQASIAEYLNQALGTARVHTQAARYVSMSLDGVRQTRKNSACREMGPKPNYPNRIRWGYAASIPTSMGPRVSPSGRADGFCSTCGMHGMSSHWGHDRARRHCCLDMSRYTRHSVCFLVVSTVDTSLARSSGYGCHLVQHAVEDCDCWLVPASISASVWHPTSMPKAGRPVFCIILFAPPRMAQSPLIVNISAPCVPEFIMHILSVYRLKRRLALSLYM
jgi:hypothetical protein